MFKTIFQQFLAYLDAMFHNPCYCQSYNPNLEHHLNQSLLHHPHQLEFRHVAHEYFSRY